MNTGSSLRVAADGVHLLAGEIYISHVAGLSPQRAITVYTPFASIRDIGTQFTVALTAEGVISTVRRGSIKVSTEDTEYTAEATGSSARRVTVNQRQQVSSGEAQGNNWVWIYQAAPAFTLEGRSAYDFLQWSVAETGLQLRFASGSAEIYARSTILHGDISNMAPDQAVAPVLSSTHLQAQHVDAHTLVLSLLPRN